MTCAFYNQKVDILKKRIYTYNTANLSRTTMLGTILLILLILMLIGGLPRWGYSRGWGYGPTGIIGLILVIYLILLLIGRVPL